jgi:hypothetical protein
MCASTVYRRIGQVGVALASLALAVVLLILGLALVPERAVAAQRGIVAQWLFTWGLIWITAFAAVVLSAFLIFVDRSRTRLSD